jgi:hypothetical protein
MGLNKIRGNTILPKEAASKPISHPSIDSEFNIKRLKKGEVRGLKNNIKQVGEELWFDDVLHQRIITTQIPIVNETQEQKSDWRDPTNNADDSYA